MMFYAPRCCTILLVFSLCVKVANAHRPQHKRFQSGDRLRLESIEVSKGVFRNASDSNFSGTNKIVANMTSDRPVMQMCGGGDPCGDKWPVRSCTVVQTQFQCENSFEISEEAFWTGVNLDNQTSQEYSMCKFTNLYALGLAKSFACTSAWSTCQSSHKLAYVRINCKRNKIMPVYRCSDQPSACGIRKSFEVGDERFQEGPNSIKPYRICMPTQRGMCIAAPEICMARAVEVWPMCSWMNKDPVYRCSEQTLGTCGQSFEVGEWTHAQSAIQAYRLCMPQRDRRGDGCFAADYTCMATPRDVWDKVSCAKLGKLLVSSCNQGEKQCKNCVEVESYNERYIGQLQQRSGDHKHYAVMAYKMCETLGLGVMQHCRPSDTDRCYSEGHVWIAEIFQNNPTYTLIKEYVQKTFKPRHTRDRPESLTLPNDIEIKSIKRFGSSILLSKYESYRGRVISELSGAPQSGYTDPLYGVAGSQEPKLLGSINEARLFHGTSRENADRILLDGFSLAMARDGMLGPGIYLADMSGKSDEYTGDRDEKKNKSKMIRPCGFSGCYLILCRAILGKQRQISYETHRKMGEWTLDPDLQAARTEGPRATRPRAMSQALRKAGQHSLMAQTVNFREYVLFEDGSVVPDFLIEYRRKYP